MIGDSKPAPLLTLIVGPSEEGREVGKAKKEMAEQESVRYKFWQTLLDRAKERTSLHTGVSPNSWTWLGTGGGRSGLALNYVARKHATQVELYIDRGKDLADENKSVFDQLKDEQQAIEDSYGAQLIWEKMETKRACRISERFESGGYRDPEEAWPKIHDAMIDGMIRLEKALAPHIKKLSI